MLELTAAPVNEEQYSNVMSHVLCVMSRHWNIELDEALQRLQASNAIDDLIIPCTPQISHLSDEAIADSIGNYIARHCFS